MTDTENLETIVNSPEATNAELAKADDSTAYIEERREQEAEDTPPSDEVDALAKQVRDTNPEFKEAKKASRYERLKRARDQYKAEAEELRSRLGQDEQRDAYSETTPESSWKETAKNVDSDKLESSLEAAKHLHGDGFQKAYEAFVDHVARTGDQAAYQRVMTSADQGAELVQWWNEQGNPSPSPEAVEAAMQQGRQEQEYQQALAERDAEIRAQEAARIRSEAFAAQCPDFVETVQSLDGFVDSFPPLMTDLIRRSEVGPQIAYALAKDFWDVNSNGWLDHAQTLTHDPIAQARMVGAMEQAILSSRSQGNAIPGTARGRATRAPAPLSPVRGGSSPPKDLHSLAKSDSADDYIRARRSAP